MEIVVPFLVFLPLGLVAIALCLWTVNKAEYSWLFRLLLAAFLLRLAMAVMFAILPEFRIFHDDANGYEAACMKLSAAWTGRGPPQPPVTAFPNWGYFWLSGATCYVFGSYRANVPFLNCVLGMVTVFLVYRLARHFFHVRVARLAGLLVAFTPSMVLWSSVALKDTLSTLLIILTLSSAIKLKERFNLANLVGTLLPILALQPVRFYIVYFVGFAVLTSLLFDRGERLVTGVYKQILVAGLALGLFAMVGVTAKVQEGTEVFSLDRVSSFRTGMADAGSGFKRDVDISTPGRAIAFLPFGLAVLLLGPFPWQMTSSLRATMSAPETIVWWMLVPALVRGLRLAIRSRLRETSPLLLFAVTLSCAYSLIHGNAGSAFRQRSQIFVFLFIFVALGWYEKKCRLAGIDERLLLAGATPDPGPVAPPRMPAADPAT